MESTMEIDPTVNPVNDREKLRALLEETYQSDNNDQNKSPEIQRNYLPGEATIQPIPSIKFQQIINKFLNDTETLPNDKKNDKELKELKELKEKEKELKSELRKVEQLKENYMEDIIKTLNKKLDYIGKEWNQEFININNVVNKLNDEKLKLEKNINEWEKKYDQSQEKLINKEKKYNELYKKNEELRNEAEQLKEQLKRKDYKKNEVSRNVTSEYRSDLGDVKNFHIQFIKDIDIIQDKINEFCRLKGGVELNEQNLATLLSEKFKCKYEPEDKVLPKAALKRLILEIILERTNDYINKSQQPQPQPKENDENKTENKYLELEILNSTNQYLLKIKTLINSRNVTDEVSFAAPNKIRQLVHVVLGNHGFGLNSDGGEHEFVHELKEEIIMLMNQFRTIKRANKKKDNEDMIGDIIKSVIKLFIFHINVLEPPGEIMWIPKDKKVDPTLMEVVNLEDDNYDNWIVTLCIFPLIGINLKSETDRKVLVPAKIMAIETKKSSISFKFRNLFRQQKLNEVRN
ncbi:hypothetical protein C1645_740475 [Glomus cerebriforme]|uniref:Uncharacterized protein n=1 Tax=Glomus cerebriforme TaxID=658196 RepID=A0A397SSL1_9GLOM|nr:hypothetical protein C1645_740475 [Glomus cerebriforme]